MLLQIGSFEIELHRGSIFLRIPRLFQMFWHSSFGLSWDWLRPQRGHEGNLNDEQMPNGTLH